MFLARRTLILSLVALCAAVLCLISPHALHLEGPGAGLLIAALGLLVIYGFQRRREQGIQEQVYVDRYEDFEQPDSPTSHGSGYIGLDFPRDTPPESL